MKIRIFCCIAIVGIAGIFTSVSTLAKTPFDFKRVECVGRFEITLPSEADVAAYTYANFSREMSEGTGQPNYEFSDGQAAGWSYINLGLPVFVSHRLESKEIEDIEHRFFDVKKGYLAKQAKMKRSARLPIGDIDVGDKKVVAWNISSYIRALITVGDHLIALDVDEKEGGLDAGRRRLVEISSNIKPRPIFTSPGFPGICLPYLFLGGEAWDKRSVSVTYRLKVHPDIVISLSDSRAQKYDSPIRERNSQPAQEIENFWSQYILSENNKEIKNAWAIKSMHETTIAGHDGSSSFVEIVRKSGETDYGYIAVVRGDPEAKTDSPDMQFFVISDRHRALVKGMKPVEKNEFLEITEEIRSSIRHRKWN